MTLADHYIDGHLFTVPTPAAANSPMPQRPVSQPANERSAS